MKREAKQEAWSWSIVLRLATSKYGRYAHTDDGVEVGRIFHSLRSVAREDFHEPFKGIFAGHLSMPSKGLIPTQRLALGAIFVYQLTLR